MIARARSCRVSSPESFEDVLDLYRIELATGVADANEGFVPFQRGFELHHSGLIRVSDGIPQQIVDNHRKLFWIRSDVQRFIELKSHVEIAIPRTRFPRIPAISQQVCNMDRLEQIH